MGAWGVGIYDNDDAADWAGDLSGRGIDAVEEALDEALVSGYLEAPEGARALAAADVVARLRSGGGEVSPYAENVATWVREHPAPPPAGLVDKAIRAVARVRDGDSELLDLWTDAGEALDQWLAVLADVEARLAS